MAENDKPIESTIKEVSVEGYAFKVDTDLLDDVEAFELIDLIENKGRVAAIVPLLTFMIGQKGYQDMKAHFTQEDAKAHAAELKAAGKPVDKDYKPRFRMPVLQKVYMAIIEKFDPKD